MEKLKLRGKSALDNSWVFGIGIKETPIAICLLQEDNIDEKPPFIETWHSVKIYTLGLFSGVKDKQNNEIYEGDILGCPLAKEKYHPLIVEFHEGIFWAVCRDLTQGYDQNKYGIDRQHLKDILYRPQETYVEGKGIGMHYWEKIGNIYDLYPHLFKEKE